MINERVLNRINNNITRQVRNLDRSGTVRCDVTGKRILTSVLERIMEEESRKGKKR